MAPDSHQRTTEGEEENKARKLLIGLRKVKAPSDFRLRLQRRLTEERRRMLGRSFRTFSIMPLRIPIYAASVIALAGVSILAYYALIRTGVTPEEFSSPELKNGALPLGDSVSIQEWEEPADRDEQPVTLEERSSRMYPRGQKAPPVPHSRELEEDRPAGDLRRMDNLQFAVPSKAAKIEAKSGKEKELDSIATEQDSLDQAEEKKKEPPQAKE